VRGGPQILGAPPPPPQPPKTPPGGGGGGATPVRQELNYLNPIYLSYKDKFVCCHKSGTTIA